MGGSHEVFIDSEQLISFFFFFFFTRRRLWSWLGEHPPPLMITLWRERESWELGIGIEIGFCAKWISDQANSERLDIFVIME